MTPEIDKITHYTQKYGINNNIPNEISQVEFVCRPYHYLMEVERLFPKDPRLGKFW